MKQIKPYWNGITYNHLNYDLLLINLADKQCNANFIIENTYYITIKKSLLQMEHIKAWNFTNICHLSKAIGHTFWDKVCHLALTLNKPWGGGIKTQPIWRLPLAR